MLNSVSPRPISTRRSAGSDAISPHTDTGMPLRDARRGGPAAAGAAPGMERLVEADTRSSVRSTASVYWIRSFVPMARKSDLARQQVGGERRRGHFDHHADGDSRDV